MDNYRTILLDKLVYYRKTSVLYKSRGNHYTPYLKVRPVLHHSRNYELYHGKIPLQHIIVPKSLVGKYVMLSITAIVDNAPPGTTRIKQKEITEYLYYNKPPVALVQQQPMERDDLASETTRTTDD
jgi:hypothetical protein